MCWWFAYGVIRWYSLPVLIRATVCSSICLAGHRHWHCNHSLQTDALQQLAALSGKKKKKNVHSREKKNPQDNGDRLALIVFLNPIFWVLPVPRLAQNMMGVANSVGLATPSSQLLLWSHSNRALSWLTMGRLWKKMDCLKVCAFKKKSASLSRQHDIITEKKNMKPQCCHVTSWILLSFLLLFPSNCYYAKWKQCTMHCVRTLQGFK